MRKLTLISRTNPKTGEIERPWQDEDGNYVLANPVAGAERHHRDKSVLTPNYDEAVNLVRDRDHSIRMKGKGTPPSLISPPSLRFDEVETSLPVGVLLREAPVERAELHKELAQAIIAQASAIVCWGSAQAGEAFIGFPPEDVSLPYENAEWQQIDLGRFAATSLFDMAYDYAYQVGNPDRFGPEVWTDLAQVIDSASSGHFSVHSPMADESSVIRCTGDMAHARWMFDNEPWCQLSVRHLALLAQMDEAAARNSLAKAGISAKGGIDNAVAQLWLKGRRGFVATES